MKISGVLLALFSLLGPNAKSQVSPRQDPSRLRTGVTAVPIDVRVLDRNGRPITDLTKADFRIFEDGIEQQLTQFSAISYALADDKRRTVSGDVLGKPQRTFLIVLGRGRLEGVAKGLTGLIQFLRSGLVAGDRVAVLAYKRVTGFSDDIEPLVRLIQRYETGHAAIEARLDHFFLSKEVNDQIDSLLVGPGLPTLHEIPHSYPPTNVGQLYLGIEYLRRLEGEKHIIFLSEDGVNFGQRITASLAKAASDARVTISPIQTSGTPSRIRQPSPRSRSTVVRQSARSMTQAFAYADLRKLALETGGVSSAYEYVEDTLERLNSTTGFQYLLGYEPANPSWDSRHREIEVKVNRSGVTILHRHSYYAGPEVLPQEKAKTFAEARIAGASRQVDEIRDIKVNVAMSPASLPRRSDERSDLSVDMVIDITALGFDEVAGVYSAALDVAIFCGDRNERVIGELWRQIELKLSDASRQQAIVDGFRTTLKVPIAGTPAYLKAVVYDRGSDRLGTSLLKID